MEKTEPTQTLIHPKAAAKILDISSVALLKGMCGTDSLTQVRRPGSKRVSFIFEEVEALKTKWIEDAKEYKERLRAKERKGLRLARGED